MMHIGWSYLENASVTRVKIRTALNSVIRYRQRALRHHRLAKEKNKVAFEQLQADN